MAETTALKAHTLSVRFSDAFLDGLREIAVYEQCSVGSIVRKGVIAYLEHKSDFAVKYAQSLLSSNNMLKEIFTDLEGEVLTTFIKKWCDVWKIPYDHDEIVKRIEKNYQLVQEETDTAKMYTRLRKQLRESS